MVSVVHSVAAQSDLEHSLQTLSEGLSADEAEAIRAAVEFAQSIYGDSTLGSGEGVWHHALGMALIFTFFPQASGMLLIAAFRGCWQLLAGLVLALYWSRRAPLALPAGEATP